MNESKNEINYLYYLSMISGILIIATPFLPLIFFNEIKIGNWSKGPMFGGCGPEYDCLGFVMMAFPSVQIDPRLYIATIVIIIFMIISVYKTLKASRNLKNGIISFQKYRLINLNRAFFIILIFMYWIFLIEATYAVLGVGFWSQVIAGPGVYLPFVSCVLILAEFFINRYKSSSETRKRKLKYGLIGALLGGFVNLIIGVILIFNYQILIIICGEILIQSIFYYFLILAILTFVGTFYAINHPNFAFIVLLITTIAGGVNILTAISVILIYREIKKK